MNKPIDWRTDLERMLIAAGTTGLKQTELVIRLRNLVHAQKIEEHLRALQAEGKADCFKVPTVGLGLRSGRYPTIWRATKKILEG